MIRRLLAEFLLATAVACGLLLGVALAVTIVTALI